MNIFRSISRIILIIALVAVPPSAVAQQKIISAISKTPMPNATLYLPAPPDSLSLAFSNDVYQYMLAKNVRETDRGTQAYNDVPYGTEQMISRMSPIIGLTISNTATPELYQLFTSAISAIGNTCLGPKNYYSRRRPFDRFGDSPFTPERPASLISQGSYPSAHSMLGWAAALVLCQINPEQADDIITSGWEYGQSRVIAGVHWQSDVDASRMMSAASVARLLGNNTYIEQLTRAQEEYDRITGHSRTSSLNDRIPLFSFLPPPPDSTGAAFAADVTQLFATKPLRTTDRGQQAIEHADISPQGLCRIFSRELHLDLSQTETPEIYQLLKLVSEVSLKQNQYAREAYSRLRPLARFNNEKLITTENADSLISTNSYPSLHATTGWLAAMLLTGVAPDFQNNILITGREIGQSRVITAANYQSDVDAGRLQAGILAAIIANDPDVLAQLSRAAEEYRLKTASVPTIQQENGHAPEYTLDGRPATTLSRGIIVSKNSKILRP